MQGEAKITLIKDLVILAISVAITIAMMEVFPPICLFAAIPFGWRWASKIFTAVTFNGVVAKALFSAVLGWIAVPVVLIKDIIAVVIESKTSGEN